jgi:hypothetical protein
MRIALASLRLAQHDLQAATTALAPILDGSVPAGSAAWIVEAPLLEAIARDALGDEAAGRARPRACPRSRRAHPHASPPTSTGM